MMEPETLAVIWIISELIIGLALIGSLIYLGYLEYKINKDVIDTTKEHNGTCIDKGFYNECSYYGTSRCYVNNKEVNCSDV